MKFTGIVFTVLYLQASASFLDNFRTAIYNVEHGFEKLLTDVVTDVKDTIHCTISAVEQVLVLNRLLDETSTYNYGCRDMRKETVPINITPSPKRDQRSLYGDFNRIQYPNRILDHRQSPRHISIELGKSIANVNKTINEILNRPEGNSNLKIVSKTMRNETNRLAEISEILKRELENISSNIRFEIKKLHFDRHKLNVESPWEQFKTLYDVQKGSKNRSEVNEIRKVLDEVVDKLHLNSDNTTVLDNYNLKEIRKKLQNYNYSDKHVEDDSDAHLRTRDLSLYKSETVIHPKTFQDLAKKIINRKNVNDDQTTTRKSLFDTELDSFNYLTPFSNTNVNDKKVITNTKKIIAESQHTDKILNNFFNEHHSGGTNVFSDHDLFNFS
ncbi:unnamed protein product [Euphydryas editha]|uniref:Uncharacterized protein n=1 Tax=Euphydryas editha TaxID=104508 RepID=A0AAU9V2B8_EUPED|nr:unnamed protein product [Euphydryas editha]